jgi:hypothetical protein
MSFSMARLLLHSDQTPAQAREAIQAAYAAPEDRRGELLESAARILHRETQLDCADVLELVDLPPEGSCV